MKLIYVYLIGINFRVNGVNSITFISVKNLLSFLIYRIQLEFITKYLVIC